MTSVDFHPAARAELAAAIDWYLERSVGAVHEFIREIDHALQRIAEAPDRYPATLRGRRRFVLLKFPLISCTERVRRESRSWQSHTTAAVPAIGSNAKFPKGSDPF